MCILVNSLTNDKNRKIVVTVSNEITICSQVLKDFLDTAHEEVKTLASLYSEVVSYNYSSVTYTHLGQAIRTHVPILILTVIRREEMQILCPITLVRIQLDVLLSKVHAQIFSSRLSKAILGQIQLFITILTIVLIYSDQNSDSFHENIHQISRGE